MPRIAKCGTQTGYERHKRLEETPCQECVLANREALRIRKRNQRARDKSKANATTGGSTMYTIEDHETIIDSLSRSIEILEKAVETEESKSNRNLSGLTRSLADLHEKVAQHKAAIREIEQQEALDNESESEVSSDPFDIFARDLHKIALSNAEDTQDVSTGD